MSFSDENPVEATVQHLPLEGIRVVDLSRALSGPFCAVLLADLGADVIKVEQPPQGDMMRAWGPFDGGESVYFLSVNRNKRGIALDLNHPDGRDALGRLVARADVLVENFRPGVMERLGLGEQTLERDFPGVIRCSVTAFGPRGPYAHLPGFDQVAQAMGGLMSVTGQPGGEPTRLGVAISDMLSGTFAALAATAALVARPRPPGQVGTSLLESVLGVLTFQAQKYLSLGEVPVPQGNDHPVISPYGLFHAADGPLILACATESMWRKLCEVLDLTDVADDARFADNTGRVAHRRELTSLINERLASASRQEWLTRLAEAGVPAGPVADMEAVFEDPQVVALGSVEEVEHATIGPLRLVRPPFHIGGLPVPIRRPPPVLGEHTVEVLLEAGLTRSDIDALIEDAVAVQARQPTS